LKKPIARRTSAQRASAPRLSEAQAKHAEAVCRKVVSRFGTFQPSDLDDLVQEALVSLVEEAPISDEDVGLCALGHLRRAVHRKRYSNGQQDARHTGTVRRQQDLESAVAEADSARDRISSAIDDAGLSKTEKLYLMSYLSGDKGVETARRYGVTPQAVCFSFRAAFSKLASVIEWPV
jgi:DNA-directed RNA polymerase specialized sigma24 family protein